MPSISPDTNTVPQLDDARQLLDEGQVEEARRVVQAFLKSHVGHRPALALMREINRRVSLGPRAPEIGSAWAPGRILFDDVSLIALLGKGGMGEVFLARSPSQERAFAVKTILASRLANRDNQAMFFRELQTWIDLPEHPHLVACRFFRTFEDRIAIFSDVVEGGTLKDWIYRGRLTTVESILDVAIQIAWGLELAHDTGVIHRDIKPANILMTGDGLAKITDFGLARARPIGSGGVVGPSGFSSPISKALLMTAGGMTPAYCSPEQAAGEPLDHRTDIWSWALVVLEMFAGQLPCLIGSGAMGALERLMETSESKTAIPDEVANLLRRCFAPASSDRWGSMREVTSKLGEIFESLSKKPLRRSKPIRSLERSDGWSRVRGAKRRWADPSTWEERLQHTQGGLGERSPDTSEAAFDGSLRALAVADLARYVELSRELEQRFDEGNIESSKLLASLLEDKAVVQNAAGDLSGWLDSLARSTSLLERLVAAGHRDLRRMLSFAVSNEADARADMGQVQHSLALHDRAIALCEELDRDDSTHPAERTAEAYFNKSDLVGVLGRHRESLELADRGLAILERILSTDQRPDLLEDLALATSNKATSMIFLEDYEKALALLSKSVAVWEPLVFQDGRNDLAAHLANAWHGQAVIFSDLGQEDAALPIFERSISLHERLVYQEWRRDLADQLARTYMDQANLLSSLGKIDDAKSLYEKSMAIFERLVFLEGRSDLTSGYVVVLHNQAIFYLNQADHPSAQRLYDQCIAILDRLWRLEQSDSVAKHLATLYSHKANALLDLDAHHEARTWYERSIALLQRLAHNEQDELRDEIAEAKVSLAYVLSLTGSSHEALLILDQCIASLEALVNEGREDMRSSLANALQNRGVAFGMLEEHQLALECSDRALEILLGNRHPSTASFTYSIADARVDRATTLLALGRRDEATREAETALSLLEQPEALGAGLTRVRKCAKRARDIVENSRAHVVLPPQSASEPL